MAVIQSDNAGGTAVGGRSATRFAKEAIGNFFLVFAFGVAISTHSWFSPLLIGVPLVVMICSSIRVLGGHYSPAVTVAMLIRRRLAVPTALVFWMVQVGAGLVAAVSVNAIADPGQLAVTAATTLEGTTLLATFAIELVLTSALCCVALEVSTGDRREDDHSIGWPIRLSVVASVVAIGAIAIGTVGPVGGFGDVLHRISSAPTLWVYLMSQLLSGIAATFMFLSLGPTAEQRQVCCSPPEAFGDAC